MIEFLLFVVCDLSASVILIVFRLRSLFCCVFCVICLPV